MASFLTTDTRKPVHRVYRDIGTGTPCLERIRTFPDPPSCHPADLRIYCTERIDPCAIRKTFKGPGNT